MPVINVPVVLLQAGRNWGRNGFDGDSEVLVACRVTVTRKTAVSKYNRRRLYLRRSCLGSCRPSGCLPSNRVWASTNRDSLY